MRVVVVANVLGILLLLAVNVVQRTWIVAMREEAFQLQRANDDVHLQNHSIYPTTNNNTYHHVIFSTRRKSRRMFETLVHLNARNAALDLPGRITLLSFSDKNARIRTNRYGYPFLKDMYIQAQSLVPDAHTYTYANGDIIFNASFVDTMDVIYSAAHKQGVPPTLRTIKPRFMAVGMRTNVRWNESILYESTMFNELHRTRGTLFAASALDFFTCSRNMWDWNAIPNFVIGRVAYDNWLVDAANSQVPAISVIDTTRTNPVLHQTGKSGDGEGHKRSARDPAYNIKLAGGGLNKAYQRGWVTSSPFKTWWRKDGTVRVFRVPIITSPLATAAPPDITSLVTRE